MPHPLQTAQNQEGGGALSLAVPVLSRRLDLRGPSIRTVKNLIRECSLTPTAYTCQEYRSLSPSPSMPPTPPSLSSTLFSESSDTPSLSVLTLESESESESDSES